MSTVTWGPVTRSPSYRRARRIVQSWTRYYTRGLDPALAADRREELASDLWEQGAAGDRRSASGRSVAASILWRAARGVAGDLAWRRGAERVGLGLSPSPDLLSRVSAAGAATVGAATLALGLLAITRLLVGLAQQDDLPSLGTTLGVSVGSLAAAVGLALIARGRVAGAGILLALSAALVLPFAMVVLITLSADVAYLYSAAFGIGRLDAPAIWTVVWVGIAVFQLALTGSALSERRISVTRRDAV